MTSPKPPFCFTTSLKVVLQNFPPPTLPTKILGWIATYGPPDTDLWHELLEQFDPEQQQTDSLV